MNILGVIPARYASTRFPGKPLAMICGKSMIQRVYEQASKSNSLSRIIVATDDMRIFEHVEQFGGHAAMTKASHSNGTSRCLEVLSKQETESRNEVFDAVINIQGDEPFIKPAEIDRLASLFVDKKTDIATMVKVIENKEVLFDTNTVKVVMDVDRFALYFSRQAIPFYRDAEPSRWFDKQDYYKHIGIYGYRSEVLKQIVSLPTSPLEHAEKLEQLRWLENSFRIKVQTTEFDSISVDTPADLEEIINNGC
jgi:3-deoxy-manno-octulosonate cytidylyltransferase (CMP-KDO synthetase)